MTQLVKTVMLSPHSNIILFEGVSVLKRCFLGIYALDLTPSVMNYINISFGDINFTHHFTLSPYCRYFESKGKSIFQGDILVRNTSDDLHHFISATEILE